MLEEAIRVTKTGGYVLVAYCMNEATMIQFTFKQGKIWDCVNNHMLTDDFRCISEEKDLFEMVRIEEINELDDATFDMFMKYHFATCERMDLIGATNHSLDILKKTK